MELAKKYLDGQSIPEISAETGIPLSTLRFRFKKMGILRTVAEGVRNASSRGRLGSGNRGKKIVFTEEHKRKISEAKKAHSAINAKGVSLKKSGYMEITKGENKGKREHRAVMENFIGRKLRANEHIHHKNGDKTDNNPVNLQVMTTSEHLSFHAKINTPKRRRSTDGKFE